VRVEPAVPAEALGAIRAALAAAGATPIGAPILQPLNLLLDLAGEAMRARLFVVQAEGGEEACLRPDFTVAVARQHIESGAATGRYAYEGPAFRSAPEGERPEEFVQLGVEMFAPAGSATVESDSEIARLAWRAATAGGRADLTLSLGDVGLFAAFIESLGLPEALAARLQRIAGRPRLLNTELARAGEAASPARGGQLAAMLSGLGPGRRGAGGRARTGRDRRAPGAPRRGRSGAGAHRTPGRRCPLVPRDLGAAPRSI
jgi:ATP phosphoribosyltransferase regulatory subunit